MTGFDHIAIAARTLSEGVACVEAALGVPLEPGGEHPLMGTHNRLLSLGPDAYLEVIAINPDAPAPAFPRWFALDTFAGAPSPQAWIVGVDDLDARLIAAPEGAGAPVDLARGDLRWRMAVPASGVLPFDGLFPALIQWQGQAHPAQRLPDRGVRLHGLRLSHPRASDLKAACAPLISDPSVRYEHAQAPKIMAEFDTPKGRICL